ncbi:MAG: hypothetical protein V1660_02800 [archaeon]
MKITKLFVAFLLAGIFAMGFAAAVDPCAALVCGTVFWENPVTTVANADVDVTCNANLLSTTADVNGEYCVCYETGCTTGDTVTVTATDIPSGASGTETGLVDLLGCTLNVAIIDVFIPEFSAIAAGIALIGSGVGFAMLRRRK